MVGAAFTGGVACAGVGAADGVADGVGGTVSACGAVTGNGETVGTEGLIGAGAAAEGVAGVMPEDAGIGVFGVKVETPGVAGEDGMPLGALIGVSSSTGAMVETPFPAESSLDFAIGALSCFAAARACFLRAAAAAMAFWCLIFAASAWISDLSSALNGALGEPKGAATATLERAVAASKPKMNARMEISSKDKCRDGG